MENAVPIIDAARCSRVLNAEEDEQAARAFTELVARQTGFVYRVAYAILRNAHDAEDVAQQAFMEVYRSGRWLGIENERAYLARIAWRLGVRLRKSERNEELPEELTSRATGPEQSALDENWERWMHRLIDSLPEKLRRPLALSALGELTSREIAGILGVPEGTVRRRLLEARRLLREKMAHQKGAGDAALQRQEQSGRAD